MPIVICALCLSIHRSFRSNASTKLQAQAKGLALSDEGTAFVSETDGIEAFRSNQRVAQLSVKYQPNGIASTGKLVAVGGGVSAFPHLSAAYRSTAS